MVFQAGHEHSDWRLCSEVDDSAQLPLFRVESEWRQLVPAVAGDGAAEAKVAWSGYLKFHLGGWYSNNLWLVWFTFGQAET
jgi:hypothetical protein